MEDTESYKNDDLGLKYLNEHTKLKIVKINAKHTDYKDEDIKNTFLPFLKGWKNETKKIYLRKKM